MSTTHSCTCTYRGTLVTSHMIPDTGSTAKTNLTFSVLTRWCLLQTKITSGGVQTRRLSIYLFFFWMVALRCLRNAWQWSAGKDFPGPWNISGGLLSKSPFQTVYTSPLPGVLRLISVRVQSLGILLGPPKCHTELTRDDHSDQFIAN